MKAVKVIFALVLIAAVAFLYVLNTGKNVAVTWGEAELNTALQKTQIEIDSMASINLENLARGNFTTSGRVSIDESFTSAEVTSLIASANDKSGPVQDTKVKFGNNGEGEVSFKVSKAFIDRIKNEPGLIDQILGATPSTTPATLAEVVLAAVLSTADTTRDLTGFTVDLLTGLAGGKPIYADGRVARVSANQVEININSVQLGRIPLPADTVRTVEYHVGRFINSLISPENGFDIQELRVENGQLFYRGTLPAEIKGTQLD